MTFRAFIGIIAAVALWVHWWLKIHEDPESFWNFLDILRTLFKFLFMIGIALGIVGGIIYWIWWLFKYWDTITIDVPDWLWLVFTICILGGFPLWWWISHVKNKWWFKKRWEDFKSTKAQSVQKETIKKDEIKEAKPKKTSKKKISKEEVKNGSKKALLWCLKYTWIIILGVILLLWWLWLLIHLVSN